jgi:hypothetical protein
MPDSGIQGQEGPQTSLTFDEELTNQYSSYTTNYFTGSQCSLFLGPVWVEDFIAIKYRLINSKAPIYGWNELYPDAVIDGNFLIQGTLTVHYRESDYIFRLIDQIKQQLESTSNQEDIDRVIENQKGKFRTRIEQRLLEQNLDPATVAQLVEQASDRVNIIVNELSNQNENTFNFDLTVVTGNYRSKASDSAIKIFEKFNITSESSAVEPDDSPLTTTYEFFAFKSRSRRRNVGQPVVADLPGIDIERMLEEITSKMADGFQFENKKSLLQLATENSTQGRKLTVFDIAASEDYSKKRRRGLLDIPHITFKNATLDSNADTEITSSITQSDEWGYGGLVLVGTNNYGLKASINKLEVSFECPEKFIVEQPVYEFGTENATVLVNDQRTSVGIQRASTDSSKPILDGSGPVTMPVVMNNHSGQIQHIDHEIMRNEGFDFVGEIIPSPPIIRGSGIPVRRIYPLTTDTYSFENRSGFTNSFLSLTEPITVLKNIVNPYGETKGPLENRRYISEVVQQPTFAMNYFDIFSFCKVEGSKIKYVRPVPIYFMDRLLKSNTLQDFRRTGNLEGEGLTDEVKANLTGEDGVDGIFVPVYGKYYSSSEISNIIDFGEDFYYDDIPYVELKTRMEALYPNNVLETEEMQFVEKSFHLIPVVFNIKSYEMIINGTSEEASTEALLATKWQQQLLSKEPLTKLLEKEQSSDITKVYRTAYSLHYDYLLKNTSGLNPAGATPNIDFSFINKLDINEEALFSKDDFLLVQVYAVITKSVNFQNSAALLEDILTSRNIKYSFINSRGFSSKIEITSNDAARQMIEQANIQDAIPPVEVHQRYETARLVVFENYIRSDYKNYIIMDSFWDTFLNFITPKRLLSFLQEFSTMRVIFEFLGLGSFDGATNILTYQREMATYVNERLDLDNDEIGKMFGSAIKEWVGYFKSIIALGIEAVSIFTNLFEDSNADDGQKISALYNPTIKSITEEEKVKTELLYNCVGFAAQSYVNVNLRVVAEEIWKYFDKDAYAASIQGEQKLRHLNLKNVQFNEIKVIPTNSNATATILERISKSRALIYPNKEQFIERVVGLLKKKILDYNNTDGSKTTIITKRFRADEDRRAETKSPLFEDPYRKDMLYIRHQIAYPSNTAVVTYGKNTPPDKIALGNYEWMADITL